MRCKEEQTDKYNWQFTFLGEGLDAFNGGSGLGIDSSVMYTAGNAGVAFASATANVGRMRSMSSKGEMVASSYLDSELKEMQK